jgi:hypothetical protein
MTDTDAAHAEFDARHDYDFLHGRWTVDDATLAPIPTAIGSSPRLQARKRSSRASR